MNIKSFTSVTTGAIALSLITIPVVTSSSNAEIQVTQANEDLSSDGVSFYCGTVSESETGETTPTTLAYVPQRKAHIPIVAWKSNLGIWNPQKRCDLVSEKFQTFYQDGRLNYLSDGEIAGYSVICALLDKQEQCSGENQLFQVRTGTNPEDVIVGLNGFLTGKASDTAVIEQSSGNKNYVSISGLLENAPPVEDSSSIAK